VILSISLLALNLLAFQTPATPSPAAQSQAAPTVASAAPQPPPITEYRLPPEKQAKAESLYVTRTTLFTISLISGIVLPLVLIVLRIGPAFRNLAERASRRRVLQALMYVPLLLVTMAVFSLPLDIYQQHVMRAYGMSVQSWPSWVGDWAKAQVLTSVIAVPLLLGMYAIIRRSPARWWFYFWLLTLPVIVFLIFVTPIWIDPLFNTFEPLSQKEPQLVAPIERVLSRANLTVPRDRMFEMKASEKVTVYNAYVTGIGATKRIVVWDNTARDMTIPETLFVFGHEMGHYVLGHVYQLMGLMAVSLFIAFWTSSVVVRMLLARWGPAWRVRDVGDWASLPVLILLLSTVMLVLTPAFNVFSRHLEHQADIYGLEVTHGLSPDSSQAGAWAFQKLGEKALSYPNPNALFVMWAYDHPPVRDRLAFALSYKPWDQGAAPMFVK
jgi:Zn-dependent protease with chaperone function